MWDREERDSNSRQSALEVGRIRNKGRVREKNGKLLILSGLSTDVTVLYHLTPPTSSLFVS